MGEMSTHFKINIAEKTKHFTYLANIWYEAGFYMTTW